MAVRLVSTVEGLDELVLVVAGIRDRARNLSPAIEVIANLLEAHVRRNIESQGQQAGDTWPPLARSTMRARAHRWGYYRRWAPVAAAGAAGPALVWHGRLARSFRRGGVGHIRRVEPFALTWGSGVRYAVFHQGRNTSSQPRTHLPRRPPIAFRDEFQRREIVFQPVRLFLQGVPPGIAETTLRARLRL